MELSPLLHIHLVSSPSALAVLLWWVGLRAAFQSDLFCIRNHPGVSFSFLTACPNHEPLIFNSLSPETAYRDPGPKFELLCWRNIYQ